MSYRLVGFKLTWVECERDCHWCDTATVVLEGISCWNEWKSDWSVAVHWHRRWVMWSKGFVQRTQCCICNQTTTWGAPVLHSTEPRQKTTSWSTCPTDRSHQHSWRKSKDHLQRLVRTGAIVESKSDFASAVVLVRKWRVAIFVLWMSMDALAGARWLSTLDLQLAYTQVPGRSTQDCLHYAIWSVWNQRMAFGLCNAPATFQRLMQTVFHKETVSTLLWYVDDVLVFSSTIIDKLQRQNIVFTWLAEYGLRLELKKCSFFQCEEQYLGHSALAAWIAIDPEKLTVVEHLPRPDTLKQLWSFMGSAVYYCCYDLL